MEGFFWFIAPLQRTLSPILPALRALCLPPFLPSPYVLRSARPVAQALAMGARRCAPVTRVFPGAKAGASFYYYLPADK